MLRAILIVTALAVPTSSVADTAGQFGGGKLTINSEFIIVKYDQGLSESVQTALQSMGPITVKAPTTGFSFGIDDYTAQLIDDATRQSTRGVISLYGQAAYANQPPLTPYFSLEPLFN